MTVKSAEFSSAVVKHGYSTVPARVRGITVADWCLYGANELLPLTDDEVVACVKSHLEVRQRGMQFLTRCLDADHAVPGV
jgi:hypothetical protein